MCRTEFLNTPWEDLALPNANGLRLLRSVALVMSAVLVSSCDEVASPTALPTALADDVPVGAAVAAAADPLVWTPLGTARTQSIRAVWGSSPTDLYAVGFGGTVLHSANDGATWQSQASTVTRNLFDVWGSGPNDVYAVGDGDFAAAADIIHSTDGGATWVAQTGGPLGADLNSIWGSGTSDVWAVSSGGKFYHNTGGSTWALVSPDGQGSSSPFYDIGGSSATNAYAVGSGSQVFFNDGTAWRWQQGPRDIGGGLIAWRGVWTSGPNDVFIVGSSGTIIHYDGSAWSTMVSGTTSTLLGVWGTGPTNVYAVGVSGLLLHYDGISWSPLVSGVTNGIGAVWGLDANEVYATTSVGTESVVLHGHGSGGPINQPPVVEITAPADGSTYTQGDEIRFEGSATDPEDGALPGNALAWSSDNDGGLGLGQALTTSALTVGEHVVTLVGTDGLGLSGEASITIHVEAPNQPPQVEISTPADGDPFTAGDPITFSGTATDPEDGPLSGQSLAWDSDVSGAIGTGITFDLALPPGDHLITFTATDSRGQSASTSVSISVADSPNTPPTAEILAPEAGAIWVKGEFRQISGMGDDEEDGPLTDLSLEWYSDLDGLVTTGEMDFVNSLSEGRHELRLVATDSRGATGEDQVIVLVEPNAIAAATAQLWRIAAEALRLNGSGELGGLARYQLRPINNQTGVHRIVGDLEDEDIDVHQRCQEAGEWVANSKKVLDRNLGKWPPVWTQGAYHPWYVSQNAYDILTPMLERLDEILAICA